MDILVNYWGAYRRRFPSLFPLVAVGYIPHKTVWIDRRFESCNFSLILEGAGDYWREGRYHRVEAPCVITQWPGESVRYGPGEGEGWKELFLMYPQEAFPQFVQAGLIDLQRPIWPMADLEAVGEQIAELEMLFKAPEPETVVDRVDRVCERLLLETYLSPAGSGGNAGRIPEAVAYVRRHFREQIDFDWLAGRLGMSPTTFRRYWKRVQASTPARFQQMLRIQSACRLLAESRISVREVAQRVGFTDEFYFSRCFRKEMRVSPRQYRGTFQALGQAADEGQR